MVLILTLKKKYPGGLDLYNLHHPDYQVPVLLLITKTKLFSIFLKKKFDKFNYMYYICTSLLYEISQSYLKYLISVRSTRGAKVCQGVRVDCERFVGFLKQM